MHRNDERVWLPELMQLKLSTLEKLVSIFSNGQIYVFCTNKEQVRTLSVWIDGGGSCGLMCLVYG